MSFKYTNSNSGFFYVLGTQISLCDLQWQEVVRGHEELLCLSNPGDVKEESDTGEISLIIGQRHENGDGIYCVIEADSNKSTVSFETDIAGGVPVFWLTGDEVVIVASSIELIILLANDLGIELTPNLNAFSEILIAGYIYSEMQTGLKDVCMLPPKSKLMIDTQDRTVEIKKTAADFAYKNKTLNWKNAKQAFKNSLITGLQRFQGKKVACLLSGGADSRIIALSAIKSGIDVDFFTFGQSTVNISDFYIANQVSYRLNKKTKCFSTSAEVFMKNWKNSCSNSNWINDSVWWAGRIPKEMFTQLQRYDVIIRGDGDGIYGWKTDVANVSDILHRLEISQITAVKKFSKYFQYPDVVYAPAEISRKYIVDKYNNSKEPLRELTNILYQKIREPRGIVPGIWHFSRLNAVDAPLLWERPLAVAARTPQNKRYDKKIIFEVLNTFDETKDVPFSSGSSWDNQLEFYYTGVWEDLLCHIKKYSPFPVDYEKLYNDYVGPPAIDKNHASFRTISKGIKRILLQSKYGRKAAFKFFPHLAHSSLSERLIIRLAVISNLCERLTEKPDKKIINPSSYSYSAKH